MITRNTTMFNRLACAMLLAFFMCGSAMFATETENQNMQVLPAPGKVAIDGKFDDWDLTAGIFATSDAENLRDQHSVWFHTMYDGENLYLLARWKDLTPLNNPGVEGDQGFAGDCLQFRTVTTDAAGQEKTAHWDCWKYRVGGDVISGVFGKAMNEGGISNAKLEGAQQAFAVDADGKGYVQELAVPWSVLTADKQPLKTGAKMRMTIELNLTSSWMGRMTIKDIFNPGVQIDRTLTYKDPGLWGYATLEKEGKLKPRSIRLTDGREFAVTMKAGLPVVNWTGLILSEMPGFKPIAFAMPFDGYVSLNLFAPDGTVARQLLTCNYFTKGEQEVKWDGLTTPYWRTPGEVVKPGAYTWKAIVHKGIGLRLRGWADNAGRAPWDSSPWDSSHTSNWGGGGPRSCATDGTKVYLGWSSVNPGSPLLACNLQGQVQWAQNLENAEIYGGAEAVAVDNGIVYVNLKHAKYRNWICRIDAKTGTDSPWKGKDSMSLSFINIWEKPAGMPDRIEGMDARSGKVYISCASAGISQPHFWDRKGLFLRLAAGEGIYGKLFATLKPDSQLKIKKFKEEFTKDPKQDFEELCKDPGYGEVVKNVASFLGHALNLVPNAKELSDADLILANRRFLEKAMPEDLVPVRVGFVAVLDGATAAVQKLIDIEKPGFIHAVSDELVYVVQDRKNVLAVNPQTGTVKTVITGLDEVGGVTADAQGRLYVSVAGKVQQVLMFTADGKPAGAIGRPGGRPALGAWVQDGVLNPAGLAVDKEGKLWVAEANKTPQRISVWQARATADKKEGAFLMEFFGPTHTGASGAAINPRDPNIMAGEGCEWRIDPKTGRDTCLGTFDNTIDSAALYAEGSNGKLYLVTSKSEKELIIRERLGDGKFVLRGSIVVNGKTTVFWADANGDEQQQPEELTTHPAALTMAAYKGLILNMNSDLTLYANGLQFNVAEFTKCGAPRHDVAGARKVIAGKMGGALSTPDNRKLVSVGDGGYFECYDTADGRLLWKYPKAFPGAPEVGLNRGAFGLVGNAALPKPVGGIWAINGNTDEWHVLTEDGFYLTRLFQGDKFKIQWPDQAVPGAILDDAPSGSGGSIRQGADGKIYIQSGKVALWNVEVTGLDTIKEIPGGKVTLGDDDVKTAGTFREKQMQAATGNKK
jgi:hypothetical protein